MPTALRAGTCKAGILNVSDIVPWTLDRDDDSTSTSEQDTATVEHFETIRRADLEFIPALLDPLSPEFKKIEEETCAPVGTWLYINF